MYKINKYLVFIAFCLCAVFLASCQNSNSHNKGWVVGTNTEFPPFATRESGEIVGFDIDVAKAVAKKLGQEIEFKDMPFDALIPDVIMGQVDFVAAGMTYTDERAKRVFFTKSYIKGDPLVVVTFKETPIAIDDLQKYDLVVNEGYTADLYVSSLPSLKVTRLATPADAFLALKSGRADAFVTALSTVNSFLATQKTPVAFQYTLIPNTADTYAIVVSKNYPEKLIAIQKALDEMEKEGILAELKAKWNLQ